MKITGNTAVLPVGGLSKRGEAAERPGRGEMLRVNVTCSYNIVVEEVPALAPEPWRAQNKSRTQYNSVCCRRRTFSALAYTLLPLHAIC